MSATKIPFLILPDWMARGDIYAELSPDESMILSEAEEYVSAPHSYTHDRLKKTKTEHKLWGISVVKALSVEKHYLRNDERADLVARALSFYSKILSKVATFSMIAETVMAIHQIDEDLAKNLVDVLVERSINGVSLITTACLFGPRNDPEDVYKAQKYTSLLIESIRARNDYRQLMAKSMSKSLLALIVIRHDLDGFEEYLYPRGLGDKQRDDVGL